MVDKAISSRHCKVSFLNEYLDYTLKTESPELFHLWSAISIISAALGRKCFLDQMTFQVYPNQFIILVAPAGRCRKGVAVNLAMGIYKKAKLLSPIKGKITLRALSKRLHREFEEHGTSSGFIFSPELGQFLGADSYQSGLMTYLTNLWDCGDEEDLETSTQGTDHLELIFLHLLGATVPEWLMEIPSSMIHGGLSSRSIFIYQKVPKPPVPRPGNISEEVKVIYKGIQNNLVHDLIEINKLEGEFTMTEKAGLLYDRLYIQAYTDTEPKDPRLEAYYERKYVHVLKVAMTISASKGDSMLINSDDILAATEFLRQAEIFMHMAFSKVTFSLSTRFNQTVIELLEAAPGNSIDHSILARKFQHHLDAEEFKKVMVSLIEQERIEVRMEGKSRNRRVYYLRDVLM